MTDSFGNLWEYISRIRTGQCSLASGHESNGTTSFAMFSYLKAVTKLTTKAILIVSSLPPLNHMVDSLQPPLRR